jgi:hypothetical protein
LQAEEEGHRSIIMDSFDCAAWQQELGPRDWQDVSQTEASGPLQTSSTPISHDISSFHDIAKFYQY